MEGFWFRTSVKVEPTKEEKRTIGRPSSPRWEIDVVAYSGHDNRLYAVECKSYLDSPGVVLRCFDGNDPKAAGRYKLFNDDLLREIVLGRLQQPFVASGACAIGPTVQLCLACGQIASEKIGSASSNISRRTAGSCGMKPGCASA